MCEHESIPLPPLPQPLRRGTSVQPHGRSRRPRRRHPRRLSRGVEDRHPRQNHLAKNGTKDVGAHGASRPRVGGCSHLQMQVAGMIRAATPAATGTGDGKGKDAASVQVSYSALIWVRPYDVGAPVVGPVISGVY